MKILKDEGIFAFICSDKFVNVKYGKKLREFLLNYHIKQYIDYSGKKIFKGATVDTCIIQIKKTKLNENDIIRINNKFDMKQNIVVDTENYK